MNTLNLTNGIGISTISTTGAYLSNNTVTDWVTPNSPYSPFTVPSTGTVISNATITLNLNNMIKLQQTKVAVFKITRNEDNEITNTEFLKEMWRNFYSQYGNSVFI